MDSVFWLSEDDRRFRAIVVPTGNGIRASVADRQEARQIFARRIGPVESVLRACARRHGFPPELDADFVGNAVVTALGWIDEQMDGGDPPLRIDDRHIMSLPSWVMVVMRYAKLNRKEKVVRSRFESQDDEAMLRLIEKGVRDGSVSDPGQKKDLDEILLCLPATGFKREFFAIEAYYGLLDEVGFNAPGLVVRCARARFDKPFADCVVQRGHSRDLDANASRLGQRDIGHLLNLGKKQVSRLIARGEGELRKLYG